MMSANAMQPHLQHQVAVGGKKKKSAASKGKKVKTNNFMDP